MPGFRKAVKFASKGRVAFVGPSGAGKSYTMLILATLLAGPEGRIAALDTEHGSLSKYGDLFDFDVLELSSFTAQSFLTALHAAEDDGYAVFCCDSLSHFWMGRGGALEFVDAVAKRSKDQMAGWKDFRPFEREMIEAMIASRCHVLCTMRTKNEYQEVVDAAGKKKRVKIGLAPVQRDGLEYEFDMVGYMDDENTLIIDKTRCPELAGKVITRPQAQDFEVFRAWLAGEARPGSAPARQPAPPARATQPPAGPAPYRRREGQQAQVWKLEKGKLLCVPVSAILRKNQAGEDIMPVKVNGLIDGQDAVWCLDPSLFDALKFSVGKPAELVLRRADGGLVVSDVVKIDGQAYKDGLRVQGKEPARDPASPVA